MAAPIPRSGSPSASPAGRESRTAYPHPNQFHHHRVQKGDSLQVAGVVKIGGCGGELYCPYQIAPWKPEWEKTWEVMAEGSRMQIELSKAGVRCQDVAKPIHEISFETAVQDLLYQRVAHGEGMEGHQEPYIALGDETVLEERMTFSMEPGSLSSRGRLRLQPLGQRRGRKGDGLGSGHRPQFDQRMGAPESVTAALEKKVCQTLSE